MIDNLISFLGTELELNAEEVADLLWLTLEQQKKRIPIDEDESLLSEVEIAKIEALLTFIFTFCLLIQNNLPKLAIQLLPQSTSLPTPISSSSNVLPKTSTVF